MNFEQVIRERRFGARAGIELCYNFMILNNINNKDSNLTQRAV